MPEESTPINDPQPTAKKVLIIEDELFIGELYQRALEKAGYAITVIGDGAQALKEAQTNRYDLILLDLMIPNVTGIEILRILRDPEQTPELKAKIIITTNLEQREDVRADIEKQADGYIVKAELTPKELVEVLSHLK
jgi:CheY-like chemotaxis protein